MSHKMPIGIQTFDTIRQDGFVYVDKTAYIHSLVTDSYCYFLSRPRRFGKSLLVSTLKAFFLAKKHLFHNLAIDKLESDWLEYPVFHIDLSAGLFDSRKGLEDVLDANVREYETIWGKDDAEASIPVRFAGVIKRAAEKSGRKVVVLVDEYDKPLLHSIEKGVIHDDIKTVLKAFYSVLKHSDQFLRFVFLTGVTKFSQVSVFSDLNQLRDISMLDQYAGICGVTEKELLDNFQPEIQMLAQKKGVSFDKILAELRKNYNGYHFSENCEGVFNPFSLLNTFANQKIGYYWFATGTPTFLVKMLKNNKFDLRQFNNQIAADAPSIFDYRPESGSPLPLLYQAGYLTIADYNEKTRLYKLGFPNEEVKYGFLTDLLPYYIPVIAYGQTAYHISGVSSDFERGDIGGVMTRLTAFFAGIPYDLIDFDKEKHYQIVIYLIFTMLGLYVESEVKSAIGRADAVVKTENAVYIFEFKLDGNGTVDDALKQIDEKGYLIPYSASGKSLVKIGVVFDHEKRNISAWKAV